MKNISESADVFEAELIYKKALEDILETGRDWGWGEDFWAVKYARVAIEAGEKLKKMKTALVVSMRDELKFDEPNDK